MSQSRLHTLFEAVNTAAIAAPTALGLHKLLLILFGECTLATSNCNDIFILVAWTAFFIHSFTWKYIIRRIYEKFGVQLDPVHLVKIARGRFTKMKPKSQYIGILKNIVCRTYVGAKSHE